MVGTLFFRSTGKEPAQGMQLIKRRASTKEMVTSKNFEEVKAQFLLDIKAVVGFEEIPFDLTDNSDRQG